MKKYKYLAIIVALICLFTMLTGCNPKHNESASVDTVKTITSDFTKEQVISLLGKPLAYDSEADDYKKHGYDYLVYSPDDMQILDWYKNRKSYEDNLPGFTSRMRWSNNTWERKYYTGVVKTDIAQMSYVYISIKFVDYKISIINCMQYTQDKSGSTPIYNVTFTA